jgi:hypothetical protein
MRTRWEEREIYMIEERDGEREREIERRERERQE